MKVFYNYIRLRCDIDDISATTIHQSDCTSDARTSGPPVSLALWEHQIQVSPSFEHVRGAYHHTRGSNSSLSHGRLVTTTVSSPLQAEPIDLTHYL